MVDISAAWNKAYEFFSGRRGHYLRTFSEGDGHAVLVDLIRFCKVFEPPNSTDPYFNATMAGRREVGLRILEHMNLPTAKLMDLHVRVRKSELDNG